VKSCRFTDVSLTLRGLMLPEVALTPPATFDVWRAYIIVVSIRGKYPDFAIPTRASAPSRAAWAERMRG
jgi:hypothetical protein